MRIYIAISIAFITLLKADKVEDKYKSLITKSILTSSIHSLKTGSYKFNSLDGDKPELLNANFGGAYFFGKKSDKIRLFLEGGFGFSKIKQENLTLRASRDSVEFKSTYLQVGGGLNYNINCDFGLIVGARGIWMETKESFYSNKALSSSTLDKKIKALLNSDSLNSLYDGYGGVVYHPIIYGYNSEFKALLHYVTIDFDHNIDSLDGVRFSTLATICSKEIGEFFNQPIWLKYYIGGDFVRGELGKMVGFNSAFSLGSSLHWKFAPLIPFLKGNFKDLDLSIDIQGTVSNTDYRGWKVSMGLNLVKF